jgi:hypothetical protein
VGPDYLVARLKALRDPRMRVLALVDAFADGDAEAWVDALAAILRRAHAVDDADACLALECITHAAADVALPYDTRARLYASAVYRGLPEIARLFLAASPKVAHDAQLKKQLAAERPLKPAGRALTLGERKSAARTHDREQILLLLRDPHPEVVGVLIDNPHVTESDVVRIASMRPAVPEALRKIAICPRWSVRHAVKRSLVLNPSTPLADAIRIATTLRGPDLQEIAADGSLPAPLREHATGLLKTLGDSRKRGQA